MHEKIRQIHYYYKKGRTINVEEGLTMQHQKCSYFRF